MTISRKNRVEENTALLAKHKPSAFGGRGDFVCYSLCLFLLIALTTYFGRYSVNWPRAEDWLILDWYRGVLQGELHIVDVAGAHNGSHPLAAQVLVCIAAFFAFGIDFQLLLILSVVFVAIPAAILTRFATRRCNIFEAALLCAISVFVVLHPSQMNHLLWPFEIGWFMVNGGILLNCYLVERHRSGFVVFPVLIVSVICMFSSAQGIFAPLAVALHFLTLKEVNFRWLKASMFAAVFLMSETVTLLGGESGVEGVAIGAETATYIIQIIGSVFGLKDHGHLFTLGIVVLFLFAGTIYFAILNRDKVAARSGLVLIFASAAMVAAFVFGRQANGIDWAVSRFHAAPLLAVGMFGTYLVAISVEGWKGVAVKFVIVSVLVFSVLSAMPYALQRAHSNLVQQQFAMFKTCYSDADERFLLRAHAMGDSYGLIPRNVAYARVNCVRDVEPMVSAMINPKLPLQEPAVAAFWNVFTVHADLLEAFPPGKPDSTCKVARFFVEDAWNGSGYAPSELHRYRDVYQSESFLNLIGCSPA